MPRGPLLGFAPSLFCLLVAPVLAAAPPDLQSEAVQNKIRQLVAPYIDAEQVDALSLGLISGETVATFHFGNVSKNGGKPTDETVYEIGSVSKVFTGILLADAVVQQRVKLDQEAAELLPEGARMPHKDDVKISLLDLSTHRSGLPRLPNNMKRLRSDNPYSDYTSDLAIEFLATHQLRRAPGEAMEYSNFAVSLLGYLLCRQAGETYDELLADRITGPLEMSETTVTANRDLLGRLAVGHSTTGNETSSWEFADMPGAGGIRSTVADMVRFAKANLDPPEDDIGRALELAWKQHRAGNADDFAMGLGWHLARDGKTRWHNGQTGGYHAMLMVNRDLSSAVVLLTNTATMEVDRLAEDLIRLLAGADVRPRTFDVEIEIPIGKLRRCEGEYELAPGIKFEVNVVKGRLMVQLSGQPAFQVFPKSETEFFYKVVPASLTFKTLKEDKFQDLELFQAGVRQTARRID